MIILAFALYQLRFLLASYLCGDWVKFGGIGPRTSHLFPVHHIAVTECSARTDPDYCFSIDFFGRVKLTFRTTVYTKAESVGSPLASRRIAGANLQEKARNRTVLDAEFVQILADEHSTHKEQSKKEVSMAIES